MPAPIELEYDTTPTSFILTNLHSLADGQIWRSGKITDPNPSKQALHISYALVFNATPVASDHIKFWIAQGDGGSAELWDGSIGTTEGKITVAAEIAEALAALGNPIHTHTWQTSHRTVFTGGFDVWDAGPSWQLCIQPVGEAFASSGSLVRYRHFTPSMSTDYDTTIAVTRTATNAQSLTLLQWINTLPFSPVEFGGVASAPLTHTVAFQRAIAASTNGFIHVPAGRWELNANMTISGVVMGYNTIIEALPGVTLTFKTVIAPTDAQIFDGTGTILITKTRPVYPEWFGAIPNSPNDDGPAIERAALCQADGTAYVQLNPGTYRLDSPVVIDLEAVKIHGSGREQTRISSNLAGNHDITVISAGACDIGHFNFLPLVTKTAGASFYLTSPGQLGNARSQIHDITFVNGKIGLYIDAAVSSKVQFCTFLDNDTGLRLQHVTNGDAGDNHIVDCMFNTSVPTGKTALHWSSSGGMRLSNNKFLSHDTQVLCAIENNVGTGVLVFTGNSFQLYKQYAILLTTAAGWTTGNLNLIPITGNEFNSDGVAAIRITNSGTTPHFIRNISITSNVIGMAGGCSGILVDGATNITVADNAFRGQNAGFGLFVGQTTIGGSGGNVFDGTFNSGALVNNSSNFFVEPAVYTSRFTWNPNPISAGNMTFTTVSIPTAAADTPIEVGFGGLVTGLQMRYFVESAGSVRIELHNTSAGTIDPPSSTLMVSVKKHL